MVVEGRLRVDRDRGHLGVAVSVRATDMKAMGIGGGQCGLPCMRSWANISLGWEGALGQQDAGASDPSGVSDPGV